MFATKFWDEMGLLFVLFYQVGVKRSNYCNEQKKNFKALNESRGKEIQRLRAVLYERGAISRTFTLKIRFLTSHFGPQVTTGNLGRFQITTGDLNVFLNVCDKVLRWSGQGKDFKALNESRGLEIQRLRAVLYERGAVSRTFTLKIRCLRSHFGEQRLRSPSTVTSPHRSCLAPSEGHKKLESRRNV